MRNLSGRKFTKLKVVRPILQEGGRELYECLCDCGKLVTASKTALTTGLKKACSTECAYTITVWKAQQ